MLVDDHEKMPSRPERLWCSAPGFLLLRLNAEAFVVEPDGFDDVFGDIFEVFADFRQVEPFLQNGVLDNVGPVFAD